jgi:hypothetical protein
MYFCAESHQSECPDGLAKNAMCQCAESRKSQANQDRCNAQRLICRIASAAARSGTVDARPTVNLNNESGWSPSACRNMGGCKWAL